MASPLQLDLSDDADVANEKTLLLQKSGDDEEQYSLKSEDESFSLNKRSDDLFLSSYFHLGTLAFVASLIIMLFVIERNSASFKVWSYHHPASNDSVENAGVASPYVKFQGLGFQIYTGGAPAFLEDGEKNPECLRLFSYGDSDGELQCYVGQKDAKVDVQQRLRIMTTAVDRAYEFSDKNQTTLKIFLAPEFFWRGKEGAYVINSDTQECGYICQILKGLEIIVQQERFKDWLFVFGTVVASDRIDDDDQEYLFYNFAPVYKGFDPTQTSFHGKRFIVPKRYVSKLDFLTPRRNFNHTMAKQLIDEGKYIPSSEHTIFNPYNFDRKKYDNKGWSEYEEDLAYLGYNMIDYGWFLMDNITFTLEICLDHSRHVALDSFMANLVTGSKTMIPSGGGDTGLTLTAIPNHQAQISLVSSAGMVVNEKSLVLAHGGSIFLQDGLSNDSSTWEGSHGEEGILFDGGTEQVRRYAVLTPTDVFFEYALNNGFHKHRIYSNDDELTDAFNNTFSAMVYKPHIVVYRPVKISVV